MKFATNTEKESKNGRTAKVSNSQPHTIAPESEASKRTLTETPWRRWWRRTHDRLEVALVNLSARNTFWQRLVALTCFPFAARSGIRLRKEQGQAVTAILPFRRHNKNWYHAMAGAALAGNSEIAGGMYVIDKCGGTYTVVCKQLEYKFLRPCHGAALYRVEPTELFEAKLRDGGEFNIALNLTIFEMRSRDIDRPRRVGRCTVTYHVAPKYQNRRAAAAA